MLYNRPGLWYAYTVQELPTHKIWRVLMKFKRGIQRAVIAFFILTLTLTAWAPAMAKVGQTYASRVSGLRVHKGPSGTSDVIGKLSKGEKVIHRGTSGGWWKVENANGAEGYVYRTYLQQVTPTWKKNAYYRVYKTSRATVRKGPRSQAGKLGTVKRGTTVQLVAKQGDWGKIKLSNGNTGWVQLRFLTFVRN